MYNQYPYNFNNFNYGNTPYMRNAAQMPRATSFTPITSQFARSPMGYTGFSNIPSVAKTTGLSQMMGNASGLLGGLRNLNLGSVLSTTQKTITTINQAIPLFYQVAPIWRNAKTMFRVAKAINDDDESDEVTEEVKTSINKDEQINTKTKNSNSPVFYK